jgi:transposase
MFHYHKRSNAESTFSMMKRKLGDAVRSKSEVGQINEVLAKVLCHNVCVLIRAARELGIEPTPETGSGVEPRIFI